MRVGSIGLEVMSEMCYSAGLEEDDYKWLYEKKKDKRDYAQIILSLRDKCRKKGGDGDE